jgi:hypothetical protein
LRSRDIAKKLSLNKAVILERVDRREIALPTGSLNRERRFGKGPGILSSCFQTKRGDGRNGERGSGWLF